MAISEEYINVKEALNRIGGSMDLYKRLLGRFTAEDHIAPLETALTAGAMEDAAHLIHTLKGVSANLSLIKLSAVSGDLEQKVKNGIDHSESFAELKDAYSTTLQQITEVS